MRAVPAPTVPRIVAVVLAYLACGGVALPGLGNYEGGDYSVVVTVLTAAYLASGIAAWRLRPANWTGPLLIAVAILMLPGWWTWGGGTDLPDIVAAAGWILGGGLFWLPMGALLLTFPFGRFERTGDRRLLAAAAFNVTLQFWAAIPFRESVRCDECAPLGFAENQAVADGFATADAIVGSALAIAFFVRVAQRFRRGTPPARRAMAPVLWSGLPVPLLLAGHLAGLVPLVTLLGATILIPCGFLVGLLRTRVTRTNVGELVVALAEAPPPDELQGLLARALGDPSLRLAFRSGDRFIGPDGEPVRAGPSQVTTELPQGVLFHDPALRDDEGLVDTVAAAARLALENARLQADVRAQLEEVRESRQRIVEAGDAERRRIERDLHDGAQQRLVALALSLRMLQTELGSGTDPRIDALLDQAGAEAEGAIAELRELARGIHPAVLVDSGLAAALESLARRSPTPVELGRLPEGRLPAAVEVAAYFVCSECLVNAAKHAHATVVTIDVAQHDRQLRVQVTDDGVGGAHLGTGTGLAGLRDRVEALGGTLELDSHPGQGTRVSARFSLARERSGVGT